MISVICCYNNKELYHDNIEVDLINKCEKSNLKYELIGINNSNGKFKSAAAALNWGCNKAKYGILLIVHQDIIIDNDFFEKLTDSKELVEQGNVIGAGGRNNKGICTNIKHTSNRVYAGKNRINGFIEMDTVDECLFCISKTLWEKFNFDEDVCDGWHLYAAELCLRVRKNGGHVYAVGFNIYHISPGYVDGQYLKCMLRLCKKYRHQFKIIRTMCFNCNTIFPYPKVLYKLIRVRCRKLIKGR